MSKAGDFITAWLVLSQSSPGSRWPSTIAKTSLGQYMTDSYDIALRILDNEMAVACIPVVNEWGEQDIAVVGLKPNDAARIGLEHEDSATRLRATLAVAIRSHELLPSRGLTFSCPRST